MNRLLQTFRYAVRACLRAPLVSGLAIVAFALGISVTTAVYTIFHGVLLKPLPYPEADRLVLVYDTQPACPSCPASYPSYVDWKERNQAFAAIGATTEASFVLTGGAEPVQTPAVRATASLADVFAMPPALGRWFTAAEDVPNGPKVVVLAHALWATYFARDPAIIGRTISLDGERYDVIGVLPAEFRLHVDPRQPLLYVPLAWQVNPRSRNSHFLITYARLRKDVSLDAAAAAMRDLGRQLARETGHDHGIDVRAYREVVIGAVRPQLRLLLGAVLAVLLIGCANVANLLLSAGLARQRELAVRLALGARVGDLTRQLVAESTLLALVGGAAGVLLAFWLLRAFVALAGEQLPRVEAIRVDGAVLAFTAIVILAVGVVSGLWPVMRVRPGNLAAAVRGGDTRTGSAPSGLGNSLVVVEIALAFALLVGAGLLAKNLLRLQHRDAGLQTEGVLTFDLEPTGPRYANAVATRALFREVRDRLARLPGVRHVGTTSHLPMDKFGWNGYMQIDGPLPWDPSRAPLVQFRWFSGEYFQALGVPLLRGRWLDARDGQGTASVLINHAMAEKFWPGQDAIGHRFGNDASRSGWFEVVGIVGDVRSYGLAATVPFEFYRSLEQEVFNRQSIVIRVTEGDPLALAPMAREIVRAIDPALPVTATRPLSAVVSASVGRQRLISALAGVFAMLAAVLAMVGVFGVTTHRVRRQRRELGIRLALGADGRALRALVVRRAARLALIGSAIGGLGAWVLGGALESMLNDVGAGDPQVFVGTALAILVAALAATWLPARSAGRTDPMIVLRET